MLTLRLFVRHSHNKHALLRFYDSIVLAFVSQVLLTFKMHLSASILQTYPLCDLGIRNNQIS